MDLTGIFSTVKNGTGGITMAKYKNLTIRGKTDGFGCQLNAKLSGLAFCLSNPVYRYVHTPFTSVSHGYRDQENVQQINNHLGIPDNRHGKKIHAAYRYMSNVFKDPNTFYTNRTLEYIRNLYWKNKDYEALDCIAVHIRRGDIARNGRKNHFRYQPNYWYQHIIPSIAKKYPDNYQIVIHSEGEMSEFESIIHGWDASLIERTVFKLGKDGDHSCKNNMIETFHQMIASKVLVQSKSGLSYTAGLYNSNNIHFVAGNRAMGQTRPLRHWEIINKK
jgi:hypothetical protein